MTREQFFREIFTAAADRGVLLTATRRLGRHLLDRYGQWQVSRGVSAWLTPTILNV
ncbi:MAG TPA: hypothetical protein VKA48_09035 [Gammaproteobacteria bacterium]|nr:hypothetical protein [Gammaproteobacteria bacterium]